MKEHQVIITEMPNVFAIYLSVSAEITTIALLIRMRWIDSSGGLRVVRMLA